MSSTWTISFLPNPCDACDAMRAEWPNDRQAVSEWIPPVQQGAGRRLQTRGVRWKFLAQLITLAPKPSFVACGGQSRAPASLAAESTLLRCGSPQEEQEEQEEEEALWNKSLGRHSPLFDQIDRDRKECRLLRNTIEIPRYRLRTKQSKHQIHRPTAFCNFENGELSRPQLVGLRSMPQVPKQL